MYYMYILQYVKKCYVSGSNTDNERKIEQLVSATEEEFHLLTEVKSSFPCWQEQRKAVVRTPKERKKLLKKAAKYFFLTVLLYIATIIIGPICGQAKNISILFTKIN